MAIDYDVVLAALRHERDEIDRLIDNMTHYAVTYQGYVPKSVPEPAPPPPPKRKPRAKAAPSTSGVSSAARTLGKVGGKIGGPARAASLSPERRSEIAKQAADARWGN